MANLGNASLILSSAGDQLKAGLNKAGSDIQSWAKQTSSQVNRAFSAIGGLVGFALGEGISLAKQAIGTVEDKLKELAGIQKRADVLGISASQLQGLTLQLGKVGIGAREVNSLFAKMGKNIADSAGGHGRAAPALAQLGINARELLKLAPDKQFLALADAVGKIPPGAKQASVALHLFGDEGQRLLPILQKGGKGIQAFIDEQKKTGNVLADNQIYAAYLAQKAWKEAKEHISEAWNGLVNRVVVALAPVLEVLGRVIEGLTKQVSNFMAGWDVTATVIEWVRKLGVAFGYVLDSIEGGFHAIGVGLGYVVHGVAVAADALRHLDIAAGNVKLPDWTKPPQWWNDMLGVKEHSTEEINKSQDKWKKFAEDAHAVGDELLKEHKDPFKNFGDSAARIGKFFDELKGKSKELGDKMKEDAMIPYKAVGAALKGSKEAYSAQVKFDFENMGEVDLQKQHLDEMKKLNAKVMQILDKIQAQRGDKVIFGEI